MKIDRILGVLAVLILAAAWFIGYTRAQADIEPFLHRAQPGAKRFEPVGNGTFAAFAGVGEKDPVNYVCVGAAGGYGGPMTLAVAGDGEGKVTGIVVVNHKETPAFFDRVTGGGLIGSMIGRSFQNPWRIGVDLDGVSGATRSSTAVVECVRLSIRTIAGEHLGLDTPEEEKPAIRFGTLEVGLVGLFVLGVLGRWNRIKFKKWLRWGSMLGGLLVLGFIFNSPVTIAKINLFLLGYWPPWRTNLYWYILLGGFLFFIMARKKNPYCSWFCPFGAAQECLGAIGNAKSPGWWRFKTFLIWVQRILAMAVIALALVFRNPGLSGYEIFGTLFEFVGSNYQYILLAIVLVASLFMARPWCNYFCPIRPVERYLLMIRQWMADLWKTKIRKNTAS